MIDMYDKYITAITAKSSGEEVLGECTWRENE